MTISIFVNEFLLVHFEATTKNENALTFTHLTNFVTPIRMENNYIFHPNVKHFCFKDSTNKNKHQQHHYQKLAREKLFQLQFSLAFSCILMHSASSQIVTVRPTAIVYRVYKFNVTLALYENRV